MHIAHISLAREYRGGDRQMQLLIEALREHDVRQTAIVRNAQTARRLRKLGDIAVSISHSPLTGYRLAGDATVCHAHCGRSVQTAALARLRSRVPYVITRRILKPPRDQWLTRRMYRAAGAVTAVSAAVAAAMSEYDEQLAPRIVHDGISREWLQSAAPDRARTAQDVAALRGKFVVGNVGAMANAEKGQRQILKLAARLVLSEPDVHFLLIGEGSDSERFRNESVCLPNVSLLGWRDDIAAWYERMDALLFPSRHEGFGGAIVEAMSFGVPVIATRVGGIPEIVSDGDNGYLCELDDIDSMQQALQRLARQPTLRAAMADSARATAARFSVAQMADSYLRVYATINREFEQLVLDAAIRQNCQRIPAAGSNGSHFSSL